MRSTDSNTDRTAADRKRRQRQRLREAGFVPMEVWVRPEHREQVKRYLAKLMQTTKQCEERGRHRFGLPVRRFPPQEVHRMRTPKALHRLPVSASGVTNARKQP